MKPQLKLGGPPDAAQPLPTTAKLLQVPCQDVTHPAQHNALEFLTLQTRTSRLQLQLWDCDPQSSHTIYTALNAMSLPLHKKLLIPVHVSCMMSIIRI